MLRDAVHQQAADAVGALEDGDRVPGLVELRRARPGRPGRSRRPRPSCRCASSGGSATTQPSSKPLSMIAHSMLLIVTGGSLMPSTHEPSHGAGQTRPVNSGKLLVLCSRVQRLAPQAAVDQVVPLRDQVVDRAARRPCPSISVPVWQNGTPQSMQRAPCSLQRRLVGRWSWNSCQSLHAQLRGCDPAAPAARTP